MRRNLPILLGALGLLVTTGCTLDDMDGLRSIRRMHHSVQRLTPGFSTRFTGSVSREAFGKELGPEKPAALDLRLALLRGAEGALRIDGVVPGSTDQVEMSLVADGTGLHFAAAPRAYDGEGLPPITVGLKEPRKNNPYRGFFGRLKKRRHGMKRAQRFLRDWKIRTRGREVRIFPRRRQEGQEAWEFTILADEEWLPQRLTVTRAGEEILRLYRASLQRDPPVIQLPRPEDSYTPWTTESMDRLREMVFPGAEPPEQEIGQTELEHRLREGNRAILEELAKGPRRRSG